MYYVLEELKLRKLLILKGVGGFFCGKCKATTTIVVFFYRWKHNKKVTYNIRMQRKTPQTSLNIAFVVVMYPKITKIENFGIRNWQNKTIKYNIKFLWKNEIPQYMKKCKFLGTFNVKNKKNKSQNNWITGKSTPKKEEINMSGYIREKL